MATAVMRHYLISAGPDILFLCTMGCKMAHRDRFIVMRDAKKLATFIIETVCHYFSLYLGTFPKKFLNKNII